MPLNLPIQAEVNRKQPYDPVYDPHLAQPDPEGPGPDGVVRTLWYFDDNNFVHLPGGPAAVRCAPWSPVCVMPSPAPVPSSFGMPGPVFGI